MIFVFEKMDDDFGGIQCGITVDIKRTDGKESDIKYNALVTVIITCFCLHRYIFYVVVIVLQYFYIVLCVMILQCKDVSENSTAQPK